MGGNSKITLEMARHLSATREVHFIVPDEKLETLTQNVADTRAIHIHPIDNFPGDDKLRPFSSCRWFVPRVRDVLEKIGIAKTDFLFTCSDFHVDLLTAYRLRREIAFRWIPSFFLFVPTLFENLIEGYRFPAIKYLIYRIYQRLLFFLAKRRATGFVVTNASDFSEFPPRFKNRLFDFYGGVNVEQIPQEALPKKRDVVFCSRLHPQKGIDGFLEIWALVRQRIPSARLTVIGNGEHAYEEHLRRKAVRLGIADSIDWLGYVNNEAKFKIYAESRLFVHPTVFDNNGMVAAEALCTGIPVIMQDLPALREIYTTGCVKVPFGDKAAYADAVVRLLTDPATFAAVAPKPDEAAALRAYWNWSQRVAEFDRFLERLHEASD